MADVILQYPDDIRPSVEDVGRLIRARTVDATGHELGTFNADTRPTHAEVDDLMEHALDLLSPVLGDVPSRLTNLARTIVALRTAMLILSSYFPQEVEQETGEYGALREQYREAREDYITAADGDTGTIPSHVASVRTPTVYTG